VAGSDEKKTVVKATGGLTKISSDEGRAIAERADVVKGRDLECGDKADGSDKDQVGKSSW